MLTARLLIGAAALMLGASTLAAQTVDRDTVQALRRIAIQEGQTSSSAVKAPAKSPAVIKAAQASIDRHRASFFARAYGGASVSVTDRETEALPTALILLPVPAQASQPVSREMVQVLRRIAIEEGQTSRSDGKAPTKDPQAIEAERKSVERHRAEFFARAYGGQPGM